MRKAPLISIITPVYNAERTLAATIDSVYGQSYDNWELILVDDGSTDSSAEICDELQRRDLRVRAFHQSNAGPSSARNRGVAAAAGELVAFLDADDLWRPQRLRGMAKAFRQTPDAGVLFSRTRFLDAETGAPGIVTPHIAELSIQTLLAENPTCSTSNIIARRGVFRQVGGFDERLGHAEDQDWLLRVALDGRWRIAGVDAVWFDYRSAPISQSSDLQAMARGWRVLLEKARRAAPQQVADIEARACAVFHRQLARRALRMSVEPSEALSWMRAALSADPSLILADPRRTLATLAASFAAYLNVPLIQELVRK